MKNNNSSRVVKSIVFITLFLSVSCSLDVSLKDPNTINTATAEGAPTAPPVVSVYNQLGGGNFVTQSNWFALSEHTTDELMGPTRGTDWDDFGTWRKLHLHTWDASHNQLNDTWNAINGGLFSSTLVAETTTGQEQAEGKFLRAMFAYLSCDLFGVVQHRPATAVVSALPDVYTRAEAVDAIVADLQAAIPVLPSLTLTNRTTATKEAAQYLLAKVLLNKAVYKQDPTNPAGPFTFSTDDMNQVIALCDQIAANANLAIASNYWDNFYWNNNAASTENIFTRSHSEGIDIRFVGYMGAHYNMVPSGWNGFVTLSDFYNAFDPNDARKFAWIPNYSDSVGYNAGFLVGQIQGPKDNKIKPNNTLVDLKDRSGNPLVFTPDASLYFSTETKGIRTNKYPMLPSELRLSGGQGSPNDFVFFRLADARLMKAEAILRGGTATKGETAVSIVNSIRAKRGGTTTKNGPITPLNPLTSVDLTALLAERGRELYLEAWRRNDMIRFGTFNAPVIERPLASDPSRCVFPIPNIALSSNPNLKQNFGY
jgi:hypothetical protein